MQFKSKNRKKFLFLFSIFISTSAFILFSCKQNKVNNDQDNVNKEILNYSDEEFEKDFKNLTQSPNFEDHLILKFKNSLEKINVNEISWLQLKNHLNNLVIQAKNEDLNKKIGFSLVDIILVPNNHQINEPKIKVLLTNKKTKKSFEYVFELKKISNQNHQINNSNIDLDKYISYPHNKRFLHDNNEYLKILRNYLSSSMGIKNWHELRKNVVANEKQVKEFNKKAALVNQDSYENLAYKGFTIPSYDKKSNVKGLELFEGLEIGKIPSWVDSLDKKGDDVYKTIGLARKIVNQKYLDIAKQTFSINLTRKNDFKKEIDQIKQNLDLWNKEDAKEKFEQLRNEEIKKLEFDKKNIEEYWNEKIKNTQDHLSRQNLENEKEKNLKAINDKIQYFKKLTLDVEKEILRKKIVEFEKMTKENIHSISENGTMWILDYQLSDNGYPTKWYFGTNSHVARALVDNLTSFSITKINNNLEIGQTLNLSRLDEKITTFYFNDKKAIKKVFDGIGYLNKKPFEFLIPEQKKKFQDYEAFADFAVFEVDFSQIKKLYASSNQKDVTAKYEEYDQKNFAQNLAKEITNDYANQTNKHIKFRKNSYLKDYKNIDYPLQGNNPSDLEYLYAVGWPRSTGDFYLDKKAQGFDIEWARQSLSLWFNTDFSYYNKEIQKQEFDLNNKIDQGNFLSYNVGYRSFINKPGIVDTFIAAPKFGDGFYELNGKKYINMTLGYVPRYYAPIAGASGSSIRNQDNELVSIYYSTNNGARAGLSAAFRSEGFDYQGLYGKYNLPQYDLIYGGGKDQKNSYRDALKNLYPDLKTNLFKNGLEKGFEEYKFGNILTLKDIE